jgi:MFS transporter, FHS family, L-fucose permease
VAILGDALMPLVQGAVIDAQGAAFSNVVQGLCLRVMAACSAFDRRSG